MYISQASSILSGRRFARGVARLLVIAAAVLTLGPLRPFRADTIGTKTGKVLSVDQGVNGVGQVMGSFTGAPHSPAKTGPRTRTLDVTVMPEPSSTLLLVVGLLGMAATVWGIRRMSRGDSAASLRG